MNVWKMSWRNVWRNKRRSLVTIAAMTLALWVELLYSGLVGGLVGGMEDDATGYEMGDVQIFAQGYLERPSLYQVVPDAVGIAAKLEDQGYQVSSRLYGGGLAASGDLSSGVLLVGIDPVADAEALDLHDAMAEGAWLDDGDPKGVVIGRGLGRTLDLQVGSEVMVLSQAADGSVANDLYTVRGVLMSVAGGLDRSAILLPERTFRELMVLPEGAHRVIVRRPDAKTLPQAVDEARAAAGLPPLGAPAEDAAAFPVEVQDWKQLNPVLAQYLASVSSIITVVYFIVYVAVAILILNAMLMAVFERVREFGVLKAIGFGPVRVLAIMVLEGLLQAVVALVVGLVLFAPAAWYLATYGVNVGILGGVNMAGLTMPPIWYASFSPEVTSVPVVMLFVIVFLAVVYPAVKAAWISPIEAMHHQ